ncbi:MATRIXIN FAMILY PROTEIN-RELATED [Salix purpurea]|uniref:MATRIXIN FAMILY PROTEIN-RELATED n=1 Tax=Salix purpurea TaxID=77065 RepID=A0A9Q0T9D1_SALPP|nr:MATRIXIN FAMILY PROTEIN-RELATED [Salix purpurea]
MSELKKYFNRFGYLPLPDTSNLTDVFDTQLESVVLAYQTNLGLPATGKLDFDTISMIVLPRCGVSDTKTHDTRFPAAKTFCVFLRQATVDTPGTGEANLCVLAEKYD